MQWFGPEGRHCPSATMDVRVGGQYRIEIRPDTPAQNAEPGTCGADATGKFLQLVPDELIQFTWTPSFNPDENTVVTIMLKDVTEGTELTLIHEHFASESSRDGHTKGWSGSIEKLAALLEG